MTSFKRITFILFSVGCVMLCAALSYWQWERHLWKTHLIHQMKVASSQLPQRPDHKTPSLTPVKLSGSFTNHLPIRMPAKTHGGKVGEWLVAPFHDDNGTTYIVKVGWIPKGSTVRLPHYPVSFNGHVMTNPTCNRFTPTNTPKDWHTMDANAMNKHWGLQNTVNFYILNHTLALPGVSIIPLNSTLSNNHFQYMLTWGMLGFIIFTCLMISLRRQKNGH